MPQVPQIVAVAIKVLACAIKTSRIMKEFISSKGLHMLVQLLLVSKVNTKEVRQEVLLVIHKVSLEENGSKYLVDAFGRRKDGVNGYEALILKILTGSPMEKVTISLVS